MRVIAFDQATNITGWCVFDDKQLLDYGIIDTSKVKSIDEKISKQKKEIQKLIKKYKPELFAIEDIQYQQNQYTYKILAELLGVISNTFYEREYPFIIVSPSKWKSYCGIKGRKREEQKINTIEFIKANFNIDVISDIADAICIGWYTSNLEVKINGRNNNKR
jgi:crossover junction endodeoxyribonuclease RuvC